MRFLDAVDRFIADWQAEGRINSPHTERAYRECLELHAVDVGGRDPGKTGKRDVQKTLGRWSHPNTRAQKHTILRTFYRWTVYEDLRTTNPVDRSLDELRVSFHGFGFGLPELSTPERGAAPQEDPHAR